MALASCITVIELIRLKRTIPMISSPSTNVHFTPFFEKSNRRICRFYTEKKWFYYKQWLKQFRFHENHYLFLL